MVYLYLEKLINILHFLRVFRYLGPTQARTTQTVSVLGGHWLRKCSSNISLVPPPTQKNVLLNTKRDPILTVNRSGTHIMHFNKDNKDFLYIDMTKRNFKIEYKRT